MSSINSVTNISKEITEKELKLLEDMPPFVLQDPHALPKIEDLLDSRGDSVPQVQKQIPSVSAILKGLKVLQTHIERKEFQLIANNPTLFSVKSLGLAIELLEKGEPFNPEPQPDSGQGKWKETAAFHARNEEFYHSIVNQVGEAIGIEAYTADDGTVGDSVLALKVPELVKELKEQEEKINQYNGN